MKIVFDNENRYSFQTLSTFKSRIYSVVYFNRKEKELKSERGLFFGNRAETILHGNIYLHGKEESNEGIIFSFKKETKEGPIKEIKLIYFESPEQHTFNDSNSEIELIINPVKKTGELKCRSNKGISGTPIDGSIFFWISDSILPFFEKK